ncbi:hypothetical protein C8E00_102550 [Chromohalobacter marismortui]|uniref:Permease n=1 Tax=Chromohalobacter marismortui TaxID=42055 RepID=A0A4R7NSX6_9GAMM|nr:MULTISPECIES: permease [Chromohalobacter]MCI0509063.1 hypothetical protein [Chromohalobacter sp.]MCI0592832.1 hypothetical protein [Chromohalobacter sp.]TDU24047.1 hypothetical protein C8E00_102550 [Chromohalobacter marismortui]
MSLLAPLAYLLSGILLGRLLPDIKNALAITLTTVLIPFIIIYNLLAYQPGTATLALFSVAFCSLLFVCGYVVWKDRLTALTLSYLNVGWLGLPIAIALFGDGASRIIIAAYVGSSIFGNIAASFALQSGMTWRGLSYRLLKMPPVIAVIVGLVLHVLPLRLVQNEQLSVLYDIAKQLMSMAGMGILGIWLYSSKVTLQSLRASIPHAIVRAVVGTNVVALFIGGCRSLGYDPFPDSIWALALLPLLPPAANIVVLETYYCGTGNSAQTIVCGTVISLVLVFVFSLILMAS